MHKPGHWSREGEVMHIRGARRTRAGCMALRALNVANSASHWYLARRSAPAAIPAWGWPQPRHHRE